jgi:hypothetical protein
VEALARRYDVPAWAIRQASDLGDDAAAPPGQKLIVPRHINSLPPSGETAFADQYPAMQDADPRYGYVPR